MLWARDPRGQGPKKTMYQIIAEARRKIIAVARRKIIAVARRKTIAVARRKIIAEARPGLQISQWRPSVPLSLIRNKRDAAIYITSAY